MGLHVRRDVGRDNHKQIAASIVVSVTISSRPFAIQVQDISHQWHTQQHDQDYQSFGNANKIIVFQNLIFYPNRIGAMFVVGSRTQPTQRVVMPVPFLAPILVFEVFQIGFHFFTRHLKVKELAEPPSGRLTDHRLQERCRSIAIAKPIRSIWAHPSVIVARTADFEHRLLSFGQIASNPNIKPRTCGTRPAVFPSSRYERGPPW